MKPKCVFCLSETAEFSTDEHILPESLGGRQLLSAGLICNKCQNYFGAKVEKPALAEHPFNIVRLQLAIPSKRKKPISIPLKGFGIISNVETDAQTVLSVDLNSGHQIINPVPKNLKVGDRLKFNFQYTVKEKRTVCRTLLKMGLETLAQYNSAEIFNPRYEQARKFARCPKKTEHWNYLEFLDWNVLVKLLGSKNISKNITEHVSLTVIKLENNSIVFHLKLYFVEMYVPLESPSEFLKDKRFREKQFALRQS